MVPRLVPDRRKSSTTNSTATCSTWRGMGSVRLYFALESPWDENQYPYHTGSVAARVNKDLAFRRGPGRRCQIRFTAQETRYFLSFRSRKKNKVEWTWWAKMTHRDIAPGSRQRTRNWFLTYSRLKREPWRALDSRHSPWTTLSWPKKAVLPFVLTRLDCTGRITYIRNQKLSTSIQHHPKLRWSHHRTKQQTEGHNSARQTRDTTEAWIACSSSIWLASRYINCTKDAS